MFQNLKAPAPDAILSLMAAVAADKRPDVIDLTVGVYRDDTGATPVMEAVRQAEQRLLAEQTTKSYKGLIGDVEFSRQMAKLVLGDTVNPDRTALCQTPGGSGALRVLSELIRIDESKTRLWLSDPTWANHHPLLGSVGLETRVYPYFNIANQCLRTEALFASVEQMQAGDVMVLHGCCHNPTGQDLSVDEWRRLGELLVERQVVPLIDLAYMGLGDGLKQDVTGVRAIASVAPTTLIAVSCSKNFGVYRDRVGCAIAVTENRNIAATVTAQMGAVSRMLYSMPPDHGATVVKMILGDDELRAAWQAELQIMQGRVAGLRDALATSMCTAAGDQKWRCIAQQKGMFSLLGTADEDLVRLREEFGVYLVPGGRINVAGLRLEIVDRLAQALAAI